MITNDQQKWETENQFADEFESTDHLKLLLNHIPTPWVDWKHADDFDVDLVFSGHYHGGIFRIPIVDRGIYAPYVGLFPEHTKGIYVGKKATCIQTAGLGSEHLFRVFNPPEVVVLDIFPFKD